MSIMAPDWLEKETFAVQYNPNPVFSANHPSGTDG
jgi:hypothetical protein